MKVDSWIRVYRETRWNPITKQADSGDWRWTMKAPNGRIIGASTEGYRRRAGAVKNLQAVTGIGLPHNIHPRWIPLQMHERRAWLSES